MAEDDDSAAIYYISKDEFKKRMLKMNSDWTLLAKQYIDRMVRTKSEKSLAWLKAQSEDITDDIKHNNEMIMRAEIEKGYNLFWVNAEGNLMMRRCSKEEHDVIYKPRKKESFVV